MVSHSRFLLDIGLIRGEHRRAIDFDDGDDPQNYSRTEKLLNFWPYYCGAKFFNWLKQMFVPC
jgi:hypothetical protein